MYGGTVDAFEKHIWSETSQRVYKGENIKEGLRAFEEVSPVFYFGDFQFMLSKTD